MSSKGSEEIHKQRTGYWFILHITQGEIKQVEEF